MLKAGLTVIIGIIAVQTDIRAQILVQSRGNYKHNDEIVSIGDNNIDRVSKLVVNGDIKANNFISSTTTYPDYVFDPGYHLASLPEVEAFIKQFHHLKEVPSENEVTTNGVNLTNQEVILLKKIEELSLYIIDQNKKIQTQNITQNNQTEKLQSLEAKLTLLQEENNKLQEVIKALKLKKQQASR